MSVNPSDLPARWRAEADAYERDGAMARGDALLRRGDLPAKASRRSDNGDSLETAYNPEEDARDIAQRLGGLDG